MSFPTFIWNGKQWNGNSPKVKKTNGSEVDIGENAWIKFTYQDKSMIGQIINPKLNYAKKEIEYIPVQIWNGTGFLQETIKIFPENLETLNTIEKVKEPDFFRKYYYRKPPPKFIKGIGYVAYIFDQKTRTWIFPVEKSYTGCIKIQMTGNLTQTGLTTYRIDFN